MTAVESVCEAAAVELAVCVGDGVRGLSRVVNVLALLDIAPLEISAVAACVRRAQLSPCHDGATAPPAAFAD